MSPKLKELLHELCKWEGAVEGIMGEEDVDILNDIISDIKKEFKKEKTESTN